MSASWGPLSGVRVVDLTQGWAGPFCTMELGDLGADVVKVEPLDGDLTRQLRSSASVGESLPFLAVNRSKRSIALDITQPQGAAVLRALARSADVLVESASPGEMDALGLGYEALRPANEGLVYGTVTGFGQVGPYRDRACSELVAQAMSGMVARHDADGLLAVGGDQLSLFAGKYLFHGLMAAFLHRLATGEGQRVDVSMFEAGLARAMSLWPSGDEAPAGPPPRPFWAGDVRAFETSDMPVEFNFRVGGYTPNDEAWQDFFRKVGAVELVGDHRFATESARTEHFEELKAQLEPHLARFRAYEIMDFVAEGGGMAAPWHTLDGALSHPQAAALDMTTTVDHRTLGPIRMTNTPYLFSASPAAVRLPPPTLGEHTIEILRWIGYEQTQIVELLESGAIG